LNIIFNLVNAVEGLLGDLAGGLPLHQSLGADDRVVADGTAYVMDRPAPGHGLAGPSLVTDDNP
jgi:hypothetical protein